MFRHSGVYFLLSHWLAGAPAPRLHDGVEADVLREAWERSKGRCECRETGHWHGARRCERPLQPDMQGLDGWGGWTFRVWSDAAGATRCEIVCWTCHLFAGIESGTGV